MSEEYIYIPKPVLAFACAVLIFICGTLIGAAVFAIEEPCEVQPKEKTVR